MRTNCKPYKLLLTLATLVLMVLSACNTTQNTTPQASLSPQTLVTPTPAISTSENDADVNLSNLSNGTPDTYWDKLASKLFLSSAYPGQNTALRFASVNLPASTSTAPVTINSATLTFTAVVDTNSTNPPPVNPSASNVGFIVKGIKQNNVSSWASYTTNTAYRALPKTTQAITYKPTTWTNNTQYVVDVKTVVQEILTVSGWASGNSMAFSVDTLNNLDNLEARSWNGDSTKAVKLTIDYTVGSTPSTLVYPADSSIASFSATTAVTASKPAYLTTITEPNYTANRVIRISDKAAFTTSTGAPPAAQIENFNFLRHKHQDNPAWNSNGTRIMLNWGAWTPILSGTTYQLQKWFRVPVESFWSATNPDIIYGISDQDGSASNAHTRLVSMNAATLANSSGASAWVTVKDFSSNGYAEITFEGDGGRPVKIGAKEYVGIVGRKTNNDVYGIVYNITDNIITAEVNLGTGTCPPGRSGVMCNGAFLISQTGSYVVIIDSRQTPITTDATSVMRGIYTRTLNVTATSNIIGSTQTKISEQQGQHSDVCRNTAGQDVLVQQSRLGTTALVAVPLNSTTNNNELTILSSSYIGGGIHVSCLNKDRSGWAYVSQFPASYYDPVTNGTKGYYQDVFALKVDTSCSPIGTCSVVNRFAKERTSTWAAQQSQYCPTYPSSSCAGTADDQNYARQAHAIPSPDGTKVMWASDWSSASGAVEAYIAYKP